MRQPQQIWIDQWVKAIKRYDRLHESCSGPAWRELRNARDRAIRKLASYGLNEKGEKKP